MMSDQTNQPDNTGDLSPEAKKMLDQLDDPLHHEENRSPAAENLLKQLDSLNLHATSGDTSPPVYHYRVVISLAEGIQKLIREAQAAVNLEANEALVFELVGAFGTGNIEAVKNIIRAWVKSYLPLALQMESVYSAVLGAQTYVAGWRLAPGEKITAAHDDLHEKLRELIKSDHPRRDVFKPAVYVHSAIPAAQFPKLVSYLQNHFKVHKLVFEAVQLLRQKVTADSTNEAPAPPSGWEVAEVFNAASASLPV